MKTSLRQLRQDLKLPYQRALLLITLIPLFPEYISFFLVLAASIFAWKDLKDNHRPIVVGTIGKLLLVYIGYMTITLIYSRNRLATLSTVLMWAAFFVVYVILYNLLTDSDRYDSIMLYITGVAGAVGLIACLQYRIGFFTKGNPIQVWEWLDNIVYQFLPIEVSHTPYVLRACSTYSNPNVLSMYLMAVAPFVVYFNFYERREELRMFCRVCLFFTFGGIIFTFSRGAYFALIVFAAALFLLNIRHRFATASLYVLCCALLIPDEVVERFLSAIPGLKLSGEIINNATNGAGGDFSTTAEIINSSGADFAISDRFRIWNEGFNQFLQHPLFGQGAGTGVTQNFMEEAKINAIHCHNIVIELLVEGGIIALIIMLLIGFKVAKNGVELVRNGYGNSFWVGFAILGFVSSFCIQGMVDYPLLTPKLVCNFMMIMALAERANKLYKARGIAVRQKLRKGFQKVRSKT